MSPQSNAEHMKGLVSNLRSLVDKIRKGNESAHAKHLKRGKLLVRDRINTLIDQGYD